MVAMAAGSRNGKAASREAAGGVFASSVKVVAGTRNHRELTIPV
jgi:hypothetical protein